MFFRLQSTNPSQPADVGVKIPSDGLYCYSSLDTSNDCNEHAARSIEHEKTYTDNCTARHADAVCDNDSKDFGLDFGFREVADKCVECNILCSNSDLPICDIRTSSHSDVDHTEHHAVPCNSDSVSEWGDEKERLLEKIATLESRLEQFTSIPNNGQCISEVQPEHENWSVDPLSATETNEINYSGENEETRTTTQPAVCEINIKMVFNVYSEQRLNLFMCHIEISLIRLFKIKELILILFHVSLKCYIS